MFYSPVVEATLLISLLREGGCLFAEDFPV